MCPNILDLLVTSPTNLLDLLPTNLSHHTIHHQLRSLHLIHNHPKTFVILQVFNHQNSHVKKKKQTTHRNSKYAYPYSFSKCSSIATYFGTLHAFHQFKKIIHVRFSSMIYATFTQHMFSCYILISPFPQECHGRKMPRKFVIF